MADCRPCVPGRAQLPRIAYAQEAARAYLNAVRYRRWRRWVLAAVLAYMLARKVLAMAEYRLVLIEDDPEPPPAFFDECDMAVIAMYEDDPSPDAG